VSERQTLTIEDLHSLTTEGARDLVVRCFYQAQRDTFARASRSMGGATPTEEELKKTVEGAVRLAFRTTKGNFEHPTKHELMAAVATLAAKAAAMGTPSDIIEHHRTQLGRIFAALPDEPATAPERPKP
jgi:hypothetical protein